MRRVLVVDDEENIRLVLRTLLKKHGYEVEIADSGEAALDGARLVRPRRHPDRRAHAQDGRPGPPGHAQGQAAPGDGHRDERLRQRRPRDRGDEGRRLRLRRQAVQARRDRPRAPQGRGARVAAAREPGAARAGVPRQPVRVDPRQEQGDGRDLPDGHEDRRLQDDGAHHRRERHGQGARRAGDPRALGPQVRPLRGDQLRRDPREPARVASSSATGRAPSPTPPPTAAASSRRRPAARCSSTRSASCPSISR